jgi:hypothetical protein
MGKIIKIIEAEDIGSTYKHMPGGKGKAIFKTLDRGQYAIDGKNVTMVNAKTDERVVLGDIRPLSSKKMFEHNMILSGSRLDQTLPGMIGVFFRKRGSWNDVKEWTVEFEKA